MSIFGYDGFFGQVIRYAWRLFLLNICFIISCIPVFTVGAATSALYSLYMNETMESGTIVPYFRALWQNLKKGTAIWLILALVGVLIGVNFYCLLAFQVAGGGLIRILLLLVTVVYLSVLSFAFPLQAKFENTVGSTLRNALVLGVSMLPRGVLMVLVNVYPAVLFLLDVDVFITILGIWLLFGCSSSVLINARIAGSAFSKIQNLQNKEA